MLEFLKQLARQAGAIAYADCLRLKADNVHTKSTVLDLVTDTDRKVEDFITAELKRRFPDYGIYGEETGKDHYLVFVGGGVVTQDWANEIKADGYGQDAIATVELAKKLLRVA